MEQIKRILHHHFGSTAWEITRAKEGQQNAGYRARNGGGEVFVKVTDAVAALQRLGEIAVAPGVLASGSDQGRTYVIQEYITGNYPDGQWVATHLPILAFSVIFPDNEGTKSYLTDGLKLVAHLVGKMASISGCCFDHENHDQG